MYAMLLSVALSLPFATTPPVEPLPVAALDLVGYVFTPSSVIIVDGRAATLADIPAVCDLVGLTVQTVIVNGQPEQQVIRLEVRSR